MSTNEPEPEWSEDEYRRFDELKRQGLERVLGPMHDIVGHAIIPFQLGGAVDMYYFLHALAGTACATMELIQPDGSGPLPTRIGTYELVSFSRLSVVGQDYQAQFHPVERRLCGNMTVIGRYAFEAVLNPGDTLEVPRGEDQPRGCLVLDEWKPDGKEFWIGDRRHGLLLCLEVFRSEMEFARQHRTAALLERLKAAGHYPYSDLEREAVV